MQKMQEPRSRDAKRKCIEGILETKHSGINELKRRVAFQSNEVQHLKNENQ